MKKNRRIQVNIIEKSAQTTDLSFWLSKSPEERIAAVEFLRIQHYSLLGYTTPPRFIPALHIRKFNENPF